MTDVLEHRQKGRAVPPLPQFTFPDSGIAVGLRRFAPDTQDLITRALMREQPEPAVPVVEVDYGEGAGKAEENPADPDYQQAMRAYMERIMMQVSAKMVELALRRIEVEVDLEAVAAFRADMAAIGTPLPDDLSDRDIYIRHICISSTYDLTVLMAYLARRSLPTEEAVQEYLASFRGGVWGP